MFDLHCVLWYVYIKMMIHRGKGPLASRLRQRKFELVRRFQLPDDLLPGSLSQSHLRCGKPTCHCVDGLGHPVWSLTFMVQGKKHVQHIPKDWVEDVRRRVEAGGNSKTRCEKFWPPMPNSWCWLASRGVSHSEGTDATSCLKMYAGKVCACPTLSRGWPDPAAHPHSAALLWGLIMGVLLRRAAFAGVEALVHLRRPPRPSPPSFGDDALGYFTARLDPAVTRRATVTAVRQAKRHKAFDDCRFIGLALDGSSAGRSQQKGL